MQLLSRLANLSSGLWGQVMVFDSATENRDRVGIYDYMASDILFSGHNLQSLTVLILVSVYATPLIACCG